MSEATEVSKLNELFLRSEHEGRGASIVEHDGWAVPLSYGDSMSEYRTVRELGAGVIDLSSRGRIRVFGSEASMFLNGLITNDMKTLENNRWMPAVFPTVQGRLIASVRVIRLDDDASGKKPSPVFLLDTEAPTHSTVGKSIERFTMAGDFHIVDVTQDSTILSVQGKAAATIVESVLGPAFAQVPHNGVMESDWEESRLTVVRATHTGEDGFDLIVPNSHAAQLWGSLLSGGATPVGYEALEILRIEAGIPRFGHDMDDTNVVTETNLDDAISFTKGCYVGQEIIIRIKHRGHVAKKLSGLLLETNGGLEPGAVIQSAEGPDIGRITSQTISPAIGKPIALGYVRYEHSTPGTQVKVGGESLATIHELPFVRGSWYSS